MLTEASHRIGNTAVYLVHQEKANKAPLLIWCPGPGPGVKNDWEPVRNICRMLAENGLAVLTVQPSFEEDEPIQSTLTTYLNDLLVAMEWLNAEDFGSAQQVNLGDITVAGMDRGATACMIFALEDGRVRQVIALSPLIDPMVSIVENNDDQLILRSATGERIRSTKLFEEDFKQNLERLNLQSNMAKLDKALYIFYGENEDDLLVNDIHRVYEFVGHAVMVPVEGTGHGFGLSADTDEIPAHWEALTEEFVEICA